MSTRMVKGGVFMKTKSIALERFSGFPHGGYPKDSKNYTRRQLEGYVLNLCNQFLEYKRKEEQLKNQLDRILEEYHRLTKSMSN